jgi:hypothetical protein
MIGSFSVCTEGGDIVTTLRFHLDANVTSGRPAVVGPVLEQLVDGTVTPASDGFHLDGWMEGADARTLNRELLSAMRRIERRARLCAEWSAGDTTYRFFEYMPR